MQDYIAIFCVFISSLLGATGSFYFKKGSGQLKPSIPALIKNYGLIFGFGFFSFSSLVYLFGLSLSKLTVIYPISSLSYVWSLFIGRYLFQEKITKLKIVGIAFIVIGNVSVILSI